MATKAQDHLGPIGTLLSTILVAACCLGPVLFLLFGASIGALSALGALEPYRLYFMIAALGFWGYGFYRLYLRRPVTQGSGQSHQKRNVPDGGPTGDRGFFGTMTEPWPVTGGAECATGTCERASSAARLLLWIVLAILVLAITYPSLAVRWLG